ncbi:fimbria/pilus periplasmic chaperone [Gallibacterium trehalosifermentans]|uniref:Fimbria/pilus periplasmic chaperone n=1 Tax=Gallibacterium trehalosifermentans TaxID=516935 RepID=A0ABV6GZT1_9PAST
MMFRFIQKFVYLILLFTPYFIAQASANVIIIGTRIIYPADQQTVSVQLTNQDPLPALIQAWIDNGDPNVPPEQVKTPFVITPPISRIEPNKGQTLRLTYTGEPLPNDRESVFYFNLLDIPPKPTAQQQAEHPNYLQIAFRSRIKLFFRPTSLPMELDEAYTKVKFHLSSEKGKSVIVVNNPTPYYITYATLEVQQGGNKASAKEFDMVAPFSQVSYPLSKAIKGKAVVNWSIINDYGGTQKGMSQTQ